MQYVAGESLQDRLDRAGPLEVGEAVRIAFQTASGLAAAHAQGLIHRDIKPANLLLENGLGRVRITDFGLARTADGVGLTQAGVVAGTPEYMAPEQARGEPVDHRADLFSLGGVLYAMCTGQPPFRGTSPLAVMRQVSDESPAPIRSLNARAPEWLEILAQRLLAKAPADRFQSAAEVAALLEGYQAHLCQPQSVAAPELPRAIFSDPSAALPSRPRSEESNRFQQALWRGLFLLAITLVTVLSVGIWLALRRARLSGKWVPRISKRLASRLSPAGPTTPWICESRIWRFVS
jgi:serine/threonine-protein kinase